MQKAMEVEEYEIYMYTFKLMVRGYHVYQEMWVADVGEELSCVKETENHQDPFSVAVLSIYAHTVPAIKKLPFSFRSVPCHRNGNDHETVRIHWLCSNITYRLFPVVQINLHTHA